MSVSIKDLSFSYSRFSKTVLDNINIELPKGDITVFLGLNGCGKTTLIKIIAGLCKPNKGVVEIDGISVNKMSIKDRSKILSYVSQKGGNPDDVLVRDYLTYGLANKLNFFESPGDEEIAIVEHYASKLEVTALLDKKMNEISGGERQMVAICSAIIQNTDVILLDEPTSALDIKNQNIVLSRLKEIAREEGKTIILSSHNPNHAMHLDGHVVVIYDSTIKLMGRAKEIITPEKLRPIYGEKICFSKELGYDEVSFR